MKKVIMSVKHSEKRIAVVENEQLVEWYSSADTSSFVGNIYIGQVHDVLPKLNAIFVDIGLTKNGFMRYEDTIEGKVNPDQSGEALRKTFQKGQYILVQVIKDAFDEKGPKLTNNLEFSGDYVVYFPLTKQVAVSNKIKKETTRNKFYSLGRENTSGIEGVIFRSSSENASNEEILSELNHFQTLYTSIVKQITKKVICVWEANSLYTKFFKLHPSNTINEILVDDLLSIKSYLPITVPTSVYKGKDNIFVAYQIEEQIEKSYKSIVWLKNGSFLMIEQTEAMTVVDVNTGKFSGKQNREESIFQTNQLAAIEIARQLRLRDIGGMIIIDFINMHSTEKQKKIVDLLREAFQNDRAFTKLFGFTSLGLFELTRKRTTHSHIEATHQKCLICNGTGLIKSAEQIAFELERVLWETSSSEFDAILVECNRDVANFISGENNEHIKRLEKALYMNIYLKITSSKVHYYEIVRVGSEKDVKSYL